MGYSNYVALELPRKTDRLVTLRGYRNPYGILDAPRTGGGASGSHGCNATSDGQGGRPANPTTGPSERTRRKVTRYARQELYNKNPSCLADLVLKNELGDLLADGPPVMPPKRETLELYRGMWGVPVACILNQQGVDLQEDELVESFTGYEVRRRVGRLKAGGVPGLDGVAKSAITGYAGAAGTLSVLFNICLFRGAFS
ncbi:hypothetical protein J6590_079058 [Homalodisca vitripennis]|nr:hypothetical protein J6590_079058 [Homalodisca vitripennis]